MTYNTKTLFTKKLPCNNLSHIHSLMIKKSNLYASTEGY